MGCASPMPRTLKRWRARPEPEGNARRRRASLRQRVIVGIAAGVVSMAGDLDRGLVVLLQHDAHGVEHREELGRRSALSSEGHVARMLSTMLLPTRVTLTPVPWSRWRSNDS